MNFENSIYSKNTICIYNCYLKQLRDFSKDDLCNSISEYLSYKQNTVKKNSLNVIISALKSRYYNTVEKCGIRRPKKVEPRLVILDNDQISLIIAASRNMKHETIFYVAYYAGLKTGEVVKLKVKDVNLSKKIVKVGGDRPRFIPISTKVVKKLERYLRMYTPSYWLFESFDPHAHITTRHIQKIFKEAVEDGGIRVDCSFISLRHSRAVNLLKSGVRLEEIQKMLGHKNLRTTKRYEKYLL